MAEYLKDLNATQAAIRAGYSAQSANVNGPRLLVNARVAKEVTIRTAKQLEKADLTADMVKDRLRVLAFQDIRQLFDEQGNLRPLHTLSDDAAAMVAGLEVIIKNAAAGDGVTDRVHKVRVVDQVKPLEMLAKHFGLLVERVQVTGKLVVEWAQE